MRSRILLGVAATLLPGAALANPPAQFTHVPVVSETPQPGMVNGHFIYSAEDGGLSPAITALEPSKVQSVPPATQSLASGTEQNAGQWNYTYEGETGAAAWNGSPAMLVGVSNHLYVGNCDWTKGQGAFGDCSPIACWSSDGAWPMRSSPDGVPPTIGPCQALPRRYMPTSAAEVTFGYGYDPSVDVDADGRFFAAYGVSQSGGSGPQSAILVATANATVSPFAFSLAGAVVFHDGVTDTVFDDKYYLAADRSPNPLTHGRLYVAWDRNIGNDQRLLVSSSADQGTTWSTPAWINTPWTATERVIFAYPAVDQQTGTVYVAWHDYWRNKIMVDKSTDGGVTWGTDVAVATTHAGFGAVIKCVGGRSQGPAFHLKVSPTDSNRLYLVFADIVKGRGLDIFLTRSTDAGASWSTPVRLNKDNKGVDQFHPTLAVEAINYASKLDRVTVAFYDRRDDPTNCLAHVYATQSTNSGDTWSANSRQTRKPGEAGATGAFPSDFSSNGNGPGDYSSSASGLGGVWSFFSGHYPSGNALYGHAEHDLFTAKITTAP